MDCEIRRRSKSPSSFRKVINAIALAKATATTRLYKVLHIVYNMMASIGHEMLIAQDLRRWALFWW